VVASLYLQSPRAVNRAMLAFKRSGALQFRPFVGSRLHYRVH
jgi:hypothetical protein